MLVYILAAVALYGLYYLVAVKPFKYWTSRGVKQCPNPWPFFGDQWGAVLQRISFPEMVCYVYNIVPNVRYSGMYQFRIPTLVLKDPELIKQITVKDFDHFLNHRNFIPDGVDPLWSKNLFALKDQPWRDMRATLSPSFTSSKMKSMFVLMNECAESFSKFFQKMDKDIVEVEMKDTFTRFTNDVIASCAFGIRCNSLEKRDNEFYMMGKEATNFTSFWKSMRFFVYFISERLGKMLGVRLFSKSVANFFEGLVKDTIYQREKNHIVRPDMIQLLMEARNPTIAKKVFTEDDPNVKQTTKQELTDTDIAAQALIFFFAGFETVSVLMCFAAYELAANPDCQQRLYEEMCEVRDNSKELTYDALNKMTYLDMVISEALRKWPGAPAVDRVVTKPYTIEPVNKDEKPVHLDVGTVIWLPIYAIHRDPRYFENPDKFDPERFNEENKKSINPYVYIPFGSGPRSCIGNRFALLETKAVLYHLLTQFEIVPTAKSQIPLKLNRKGFNMSAEGGFWFGFKRRQNIS